MQTNVALNKGMVTKMKKCIDFTELISAYTDGELTSGEQRQVEEHLESCESCAALLALYREISGSADELSVDAPEALRIGVMNRIHGENSDRVNEAKKQQKRFHFILTRYMPIAACLVVMLFIWQYWGDLQQGFLENAASPAAEVLLDTMPAPAAAPAGDAGDDADNAVYGEETTAVFRIIPTPEEDTESVYPETRRVTQADAPSNTPIGSDWNLSVPGGPQTVEEAEQIVIFLNQASTTMQFKGKLPAILSGYEPEDYSEWLGWDAIYIIQNEDIPVFIDELMQNNNYNTLFKEDNSDNANSTYAVILHIIGGR
jgi:hypothetical protein